MTSKMQYMLLGAVSSYLVHKGISVEVLTMCLRHPTSIAIFTVTGLHFYFHICFCDIFETLTINKDLEAHKRRVELKYKFSQNLYDRSNRLDLGKQKASR